MHAETGVKETWVYVIWAMGLSEPTVKIGSTTDVLRRVGELQTGCPVRLRVFAAWVCKRSGEKVFHRVFARHRLDGEWFRGDREILNLARQLDEHLGWWLPSYADDIWPLIFDHPLPAWDRPSPEDQARKEQRGSDKTPD